MTTSEDRILNSENFFITDTITAEYRNAKQALLLASRPPKKKV